MTDSDDQFGEVLLSGGSRDGDVLSRMALEQTITISAGSDVERYTRTGEYQQLRGVGKPEPYRRWWVYEYKARDD